MIIIKRNTKGSLKRGGLFSEVVYTSENINNPVIADLVDVLKKYTGKSIRIVPNADSASGIHLIPQPLGNKDGQQFDIELSSTKATIWYSEYEGVNQSLANGVYYFLEQLGIEWLASHADGLEIPNIISVPTIPKKTVTFDFINRGEFGTGGLGDTIRLSNDSTAPIEYSLNNKTFEANWYDFYRRLSFGKDHPDLGHMGYSFYLANQTACDDNWNTYGSNSPESWFNSESGKTSGRIRIENQEALALWVNYSRNQFDPNKTFNTLPADPEDGRGNWDDPLPPDGFAGINNWTHSDKWLYAANKIAEGYDENDNHTKISIQVYGDGPYNVMTPQFPLRKNVMPNLNAWAFQTRWPVKEQMYEAWKPFIQDYATSYDYWNILQWSINLPQMEGIIKGAIGAKNAIYMNNKVRGITVETMDNNVMAPIFYVASKTWRDATLDADRLFKQYFKKFFGNAWRPMLKMYERWIKGYQGKADLGMSLEDIDEARSLVPKNGKYWRRVMTYAAYQHYCLLVHTETNRDNIYPWMYKIHHLQMVQTPGLVGSNFLSGWPKPAADGITKATWTEIETQFEADLANNPKMFDYVPFNLDPWKATFIEHRHTWRFRTGETNHGIIYPKGNQIIFEAGMLEREEITESRVLVINSDGSTLVDETVTRENAEKTIILAGETYYVKTYTINTQPGKTYSIIHPWVVKMISNDLIWNSYRGGFDNYAYPAWYMWVPKNATEIIFKNNPGNGHDVRVWDNSYVGTIELLEAGIDPSQNIYRVAVPSAHRGKCWRLSFGQYQNAILNLPNMTAMQPFNYAE